MSEHTKGPWAYSRSATPEYAPQYSVYSETGFGGDLAIVKGEFAGYDAKLIAAAPDLLAALKRAQDLLIELRANDLTDPEDEQTMSDIEAAIAKATGQ